MKNKEGGDVVQNCKFNLAQCYEKQKKLRLAKVTYEDANQSAPPKDEITEKIAEMNKQLGFE